MSKDNRTVHESKLNKILHHTQEDVNLISALLTKEPFGDFVEIDGLVSFAVPVNNIITFEEFYFQFLQPAMFALERDNGESIDKVCVKVDHAITGIIYTLTGKKLS